MTTVSRSERGKVLPNRSRSFLTIATMMGSAFALIALSGCAATSQDTLVIGSPAATPTTLPATTPGRPGQLRAQWNLTGIDLPSDWPEVPLPRGTQVASAYAVDSPPRRTWTASFIGDSGTALDLAKPLIKQLRAAGYRPVSAYSATADADAGLFGFAGDQYSVYLMLGTVDGKPNLLITVRQRGAETPSGSPPTATPSGESAVTQPPRTSQPGTSQPSASRPGTSTPVSSQPAGTPQPGSLGPSLKVSSSSPRTPAAGSQSTP